MGKVLGIARRAAKRAPMETLSSVEITKTSGVAGDTRGKPGRRQVTVLPIEGWRAACAELGADLPWTFRRANLLVEGIAPAERVGHRIVIGEVVLEVTGELDPCSRMDAQHPGLTVALMPQWRGGVTCRVLKGGAVSVGDAVALWAAHEIIDAGA
jgi:MOSC domain-containing protein YiiM